MDAAPNSRRWQFGLRPLLVALAVCPVVLAVAVQVPGLLLLGICLAVLFALAVRCLNVAEHVASGGSAWHEWAAGMLILVGMFLITLQILGGVIVLFFVLDFLREWHS